MKYSSLMPIISRFFRSVGLGCEAQNSCEVFLSPFGENCGPDLVRCTLVAEIKDKVELNRDLSSKYWSSWNSSNQKFGGKSKDYQLQNDLPSNIPEDPLVKGWLAVVYGQLNFQRRSVGLPDGWLIVEDYQSFRANLSNALHFLSEENLIHDFIENQYEQIGFIHIFFK